MLWSHTAQFRKIFVKFLNMSKSIKDFLLPQPLQNLYWFLKCRTVTLNMVTMLFPEFNGALLMKSAQWAKWICRKVCSSCWFSYLWMQIMSQKKRQVLCELQTPMSAWWCLSIVYEKQAGCGDLEKTEQVGADSWPSGPKHSGSQGVGFASKHVCIALIGKICSEGKKTRNIPGGTSQVHPRNTDRRSHDQQWLWGDLPGGPLAMNPSANSGNITWVRSLIQEPISLN